MEELNNVTQTVDVPEAPKAKVEKISLAELRAEASRMNEAENNRLYEEQKRREEEKRQREKEKNAAFEKEIDDFFESLMAASQEDRDEFFRLINEDIANGGIK